MTQLANLRRRLRLLWWCRALARWFSAVALLLVLVLVALLGLFLLDWLVLEPVFRSVTAPRVVVQLAAAVTLAWLVVRHVWPLVRRWETTLEMALLVERNFGISSDLVAALQFESPSAACWGSPQLEAAVVHDAARQAAELNVLADFPLQPPARIGAGLVVVLLPWIALACLWPGHLAVFVNRLLLGSLHYPTATRIESLQVNGQLVLDANSSGSEPRASHAAQGDLLTFSVRCRGRLPEAGTLSLVSLADGRRRKLPLLQVREETESSDTVEEPADATENGETLDAKTTRVYRAELGRFVEPLSFQIDMGDAWTDPAPVRMIALPMVETLWSVQPPDYARSAELDAPEPDSRQLLVLEGSRIGLRVRAVNDKRLESVWIDIRDDRQSHRIDLQPSQESEEDGQPFWQLPDAATPLDRVTRELRFELQAVDLDGLQLDSPLRGTIRLRRDRPPSGTTAMVHRVVLPGARPVLEYRLSDDFGIAAATLRIQVQRGASASDSDPDSADPESTLPASTRPEPTLPEPAQPEPALPKPTLPKPTLPEPMPPANMPPDSGGTPELSQPDFTQPVLIDGLPIGAERLPAVGRLPLELARMDLRKGDRLKITMEVTDDRGSLPGETYRADPLYLDISDESGVLDEISKADERSEKQLTDLIKQQLGIGDAP